MFNRNEHKIFLDCKMNDKAFQFFDGDEYAFIYTCKWLNPEALSWKIIGKRWLIFTDFGELFGDYVNKKNRCEEVF